MSRHCIAGFSYLFIRGCYCCQQFYVLLCLAYLFPVLDTLRLLIRLADINSSLCCAESDRGTRLIDFACSVFSADSAKNQLLMLRVLCNAFLHPVGEQLLLSNSERLLSAADSSLIRTCEKSVQASYNVVSFTPALPLNRTTPAMTLSSRVMPPTLFSCIYFCER